MPNLTRRNFLLKLIYSIASSMSISSIAYATKKVNIPAIESNYSMALIECAVIYREWVKREDLAPGHYLARTLNEYKIDQLKISEASNIDFKRHNFFEVKGLHLSKTEAAFLALMGSKVIS